VGEGLHSEEHYSDKHNTNEVRDAQVRKRVNRKIFVQYTEEIYN